MSERPASREHTRLIVGLGFLSVFSLMLLVAWLSVATLQSVNADMATLVRDTARKTDRAFQMRDAIRLRTAAVRSLELVTDIVERERVFQRLVEQTARYDRARRELGADDTNARERAILEETRAVDARVDAAYDRVNERLYAMHPDPDGLRAALGELRLQELVLLNHLNQLVELERTLAEESLAASQSTYLDTRRVLLGIVGAAFALSVAISLLVIGRVARANRRIAHLASHDDLTGLHNRRSFESQLERTLAVAQRGGDAHGLLYLDLDRFKIVNDTCGHHAGDQLLIGLTRTISERLRRGDLFARVGGDEFAIIAHAESFDAIRALAEDLRARVEDYVFEYAEQVFRVSLSIGVVPIDERATDMESLLADVDSACYVAKQSGRNRVHVTAENDQEVVKYRSDIAGVRSIRQALAEERLSLFFQPVFGIEEHGVSMAHCEVLLRIRSENGELYSPARFIPIAEKYNIMSEIDRWVFDTVADWLAAHQRRYDVPVPADQPLGAVVPRRRVLRLRRRAPRARRRGPDPRHVRDHRDRGRRQPRQGARVRRTRAQARLPLRARRLRLGVLDVRLPQEHAGRLPQDRRLPRHRSRPRRDRPGDGAGDQPDRPRRRRADHRRVRRGRRDARRPARDGRGLRARVRAAPALAARAPRGRARAARARRRRKRPRR